MKTKKNLGFLILKDHRRKERILGIQMLRLKKHYEKRNVKYTGSNSIEISSYIYLSVRNREDLYIYLIHITGD